VWDGTASRWQRDGRPSEAETPLPEGQSGGHTVGMRRREKEIWGGLALRAGEG